VYSIIILSKAEAAETDWKLNNVKGFLIEQAGQDSQGLKNHQAPYEIGLRQDSNIRLGSFCTVLFCFSGIMVEMWNRYEFIQKHRAIRNKIHQCTVRGNTGHGVPQKGEISQKLYESKTQNFSPKKAEGHFEEAPWKPNIESEDKNCEQSFWNCKKLPFLRIGYERQRIVKKLQTLSNSPLKFHQCTVRRKTWVKGDREMFTNILGPWSPKSRHSTVREKGVKKYIIYFSTTALKFHQYTVRGHG